MDQIERTRRNRNIAREFDPENDNSEILAKKYGVARRHIQTILRRAVVKGQIPPIIWRKQAAGKPIRNARIVELVTKGTPIESIAQTFNISATRVRQICRANNCEWPRSPVREFHITPSNVDHVVTCHSVMLLSEVRVNVLMALPAEIRGRYKATASGTLQFEDAALARDVCNRIRRALVGTKMRVVHTENDRRNAK